MEPNRAFNLFEIENPSKTFCNTKTLIGMKKTMIYVKMIGKLSVCVVFRVNQCKRELISTYTQHHATSFLISSQN